jgi:hypothetical protein
MIHGDKVVKAAWRGTFRSHRMRNWVDACRRSDWWGISGGGAERRVIIYESLFLWPCIFFGRRRKRRIIRPNLKIIVRKRLVVDKQVWLVNKLSTDLDR